MNAVLALLFAVTRPAASGSTNFGIEVLSLSTEIATLYRVRPLTRDTVAGRLILLTLRRPARLLLAAALPDRGLSWQVPQVII